MSQRVTSRSLASAGFGPIVDAFSKIVVANKVDVLRDQIGADPREKGTEARPFMDISIARSPVGGRARPAEKFTRYVCWMAESSQLPPPPVRLKVHNSVTWLRSPP
jgi:hypothetical protein